MPRSLVLGSLVLWLFVSGLRADPGNYLNVAILDVPPRFVAGMPLGERPALLRQLSEQASDGRLDYKGGFLDWHSDSPEPPHSHAPFCLKIFSTKDFTGAPLVFIHIQPWFSGGRQTWRETYVLRATPTGWNDDVVWKDVTKSVLPQGVDRASYFRLARNSADIEVAPYTWKRSSKSYPYGDCRVVLHWDGERFQKRTIKPRPVTADD